MDYKPIHLFVYGTLQHPHIWRGVVRGDYKKSFAVLKHYRACVLKGKVFPGLTYQESTFAKGIIYFDISNDDIKRLDSFEGPQYKRVEVFPVIGGEQKVSCHTYLFKGDPSILTSEIWSFDQYLREGHDKFLTRYSGWDKI